MLKKFLFSITFILCAVTFNSFSQSWDGVKLQNGDLLFVDLDCGPLCDAIEEVTESYGGNRFSHIGLVYIKSGSIYIIEAIGQEVQLTPIIEFANRTVHKIYIGRVKHEYKKIAKGATRFSLGLLGIPYDDEFIYDNGKYYCSELIYDAFKHAHNDIPFFELEPMTFKQPGSNNFYSVWVEYYQKLGIKIPEAEPGINPGGISRSLHIQILN